MIVDVVEFYCSRAPEKQTYRQTQLRDASSVEYCQKDSVTGTDVKLAHIHLLTDQYQPVTNSALKTLDRKHSEE